MPYPSLGTYKMAWQMETKTEDLRNPGSMTLRHTHGHESYMEPCGGNHLGIHVHHSLLRWFPLEIHGHMSHGASFLTPFGSSGAARRPDLFFRIWVARWVRGLDLAGRQTPKFPTISHEGSFLVQLCQTSRSWACKRTHTLCSGWLPFDKLCQSSYCWFLRGQHYPLFVAGLWPTIFTSNSLPAAWQHNVG